MPDPMDRADLLGGKDDESGSNPRALGVGGILLTVVLHRGRAPEQNIT